MHSLGEYEKQRATSEIERKAKDERLGFAVTLMCKAAGVFEFIGKECLSEWERERDRATAAGLTCPRPPDLSREVVIGLSKYVFNFRWVKFMFIRIIRMALADAQTLAIRKLLSKAAADSALTPGPPLPKSHPSPVLIAKLHLECATLYSSARSLAKTTADYRSGTSKSKIKLSLGKDKDRDKQKVESGEEVAPELRRYFSEEAAFHAALARKWLGVDAGENGGTSKGGVAVGFLAWAKKDLEDLKSGIGVMGTDREKEMRERRRDKIVEELESVTVFLKGYQKINDTVSELNEYEVHG